jgi:3',5'-cyclic AMP phosphodiesterase CpdA
MADENWRAVVDEIARIGPDLVIHCGDLALDGTGDPDELTYACRRLESLPAPWRVVAGNHDLGNPSGPWVTDEVRRKEFEAVFGDRFWVEMVGGWRFVGLDVQELLAGEDPGPIWEWLSGALAEPGPAVLALHRPIVPTGSAVDEPARYVTEPARSRLLGLLSDSSAGGGADVRAVLSGHVHQRQVVVDGGGLHHVWVPSTWATMSDAKQPPIGEKRPGLATIDLGVGGSVDVTFTVPEAMTEAVIGETFPSPYGPRP